MCGRLGRWVRGKVKGASGKVVDNPEQATRRQPPRTPDLALQVGHKRVLEVAHAALLAVCGSGQGIKMQSVGTI
jgi:hypothetical protein